VAGVAVSVVVVLTSIDAVTVTAEDIESEKFVLPVLQTTVKTRF